MENKVTIKDIARMAGISVSSVSRILNKNGRYSKETEERVLKIVEETGYTVNAAARSLRHSSTNSIMLLVPDITNEFFSRIAYYVETYLHSQNYTTFICNTNDNDEVTSRYINDAISKNVDGIIAISTLNILPKSYKTSPIPIITLDRQTNHFPYVINDDKQGGYDAMKHLYCKGCRHIVGVFPISDTLSTRAIGAKQFVDEHDDIEYSSYQLPINNQSDKETEKLILSIDKKTDGIFCGSDRSALGAYYAVNQMNKVVGKDIKIIGFDHAIYSNMTQPPLSTVGRYTKQLSETSCELILKMINGENVKSTIIPTHIIERDSTK